MPTPSGFAWLEAANELPPPPDPADLLMRLLILEISSTQRCRSRWVRSRISSLGQWKWYAMYADSWYSRSSG
jgi:hypothetical protein